MALVKLCSRDKDTIEDLLCVLRDGLHDAGIEGDAEVMIKKNGDVYADIDVNENTCLKLTISDDGNDVRTRYMRNESA